MINETKLTYVVIPQVHFIKEHLFKGTLTQV